jgi:hypothetical protein
MQKYVLHTTSDLARKDNRGEGKKNTTTTTHTNKMIKKIDDQKIGRVSTTMKKIRRTTED